MQVFLSFGVYYENYQDPSKSQEEEERKKEEINKDLNNTLGIIQVNLLIMYFLFIYYLRQGRS